MQARANVAWQTSALIGAEMTCRVVFSVVWEHMCQGKRESIPRVLWEGCAVNSAFECTCERSNLNDGAALFACAVCNGWLSEAW